MICGICDESDQIKQLHMATTMVRTDAKLEWIAEQKVFCESYSISSERITRNISLLNETECHKLRRGYRILRPTSFGSTVGVQMIYEVNKEIG